MFLYFSYCKYFYNENIERAAQERADEVYRDRMSRNALPGNSRVKRQIRKRYQKRYYKKYGERKKKTLIRKWLEFMFPWMED